MKKRTRIIIIILIISLLWIWIGLGTLMQISSYLSANFFEFDYDSFMVKFLRVITLPFNIILFSLLFSGTLAKIYVFVIILQSSEVLVYWRIIYKIPMTIINQKLKNNVSLIVLRKTLYPLCLQNLTCR